MLLMRYVDPLYPFVYVFEKERCADYGTFYVMRKQDNKTILTVPNTYRMGMYHKDASSQWQRNIRDVGRHFAEQLRPKLTNCGNYWSEV